MRVIFYTVYYGYLDFCRFYLEPECREELWFDFSDFQDYPKVGVVSGYDQYYWNDRII